MSRVVYSKKLRKTCHNFKDYKRKKPRSVWDEKEWELMSSYLDVLSSHKRLVLFMQSEPHCIPTSRVGMTERI